MLKSNIIIKMSACQAEQQQSSPTQIVNPTQDANPIQTDKIATDIDNQSEPTSYFEFTQQASIKPTEQPPVDDHTSPQPFQTSVSEINLDDTAHVLDINVQANESPLPRENEEPQPNQQRQYKEPLQILKRRRPNRPFYKQRNEQTDTSFNHWNGNYPRSNSRNKRFREDTSRYNARPYQEDYYERDDRREYTGGYRKRDYEENRYDYNQRDDYDEARGNNHQNGYQQQQQPQANYYNSNAANYYQSNAQVPAQTAQPAQQWNANQNVNANNAWLNYLTLKENLKYMDMYYMQNYPQITNQILYNTPLCQVPQQIYPTFVNNYLPQTCEAFYPPPNSQMPVKQPENQPKKQENVPIPKVIPQPFGKICLPKFEITVNNTLISITCCKMDRLRADVLVIPYHSMKFSIFPGFKPQQHFESKQRGENSIKALKGPMSNGEITLVKPQQQSSFKMLAFMKVTSPYEQSISTCFNRGLSNLFGQDGVSGKSVVLPYCNQLSSSQEKAKRLVELMKSDYANGFERIVVNCEEMASFKRMVEGFNRVIEKLHERQEIEF